MGESPIYNLPWPELTDPADVPAAMQDTAMATDGILNLFHTETQADLDDMQGQISGASGAFVKLAHAQLAANAALIDFAAIPQTYDHLLLVASVRGSQAAQPWDNLGLRMNGDVATNYSSHYVQGTNNAVTGGAQVAQSSGWIGSTGGATTPADYYSAHQALIPGYSVGRIHSYLAFGYHARGGGAANLQFQMFGGGFRNNAAVVTSLQLMCQTGSNLVAGSRATLYGLRGA